MGQLALGVVGAAAGFVLSGGNPAGAMLGFELGTMIGGLIFNKPPATPQLADLKIQNAAYGQPIPLLYGAWRVAGNVIWCDKPQQYTQEHSGKGSSAPATYGYKISFAVAFCEGVVETVQRIWANGTLVYDVTDPTDFAAVSGSNNQLDNFIVYPGDEMQDPDPTMEAALGVGNVPPNRGVAYIVFNGFDLAPYGNIIPSLSFDVVKSTGTPTYGLAVVPGPFFAFTYQLGNGGKAFSTGIVGVDFVVNQYTVTPYGYTLDYSTDSGLGGVIAGISYDDYGVLDSSGFWWKDGVKEAVGYAVGLQDYEGSACRFVRKNGVTYISVTGVNVDAVQMCQDGAVVATFGIATHSMVVIGATDDFLYVIDRTAQTLYQVTLDLTVSNVVVTDPSIVVDTAFVESDTSFYFWTGNSIIHWDGRSLSTLYNFFTQIGLCSALWKVGQSFYLNQYFGLGAQDDDGLIMVTPIAQGATYLSDIVTDICEKAKITAQQLDVTAISKIPVTGFAVTQHSDARDAMAQLLQIYTTDVSDSGDVLKFVPRTGTPVATIPWDDIGVSLSSTDDTANNPLARQRAIETDMPATFSLTYANPNADYGTGTQTAFKGTTLSNLAATIAGAVALTDDQALMLAQVQLWAAWIARESYTFTTNMKYLYLDPTDVVNVEDAEGNLHLVRAQSITYDGKQVLAFTAVGESAEIYPAEGYAVQGGASSGFIKQSIGYAGPTILTIMDIPPLQDSDTVQGLYLAASGYAANWPGVLVDMSRDDTTFTEAVVINGASIQGRTGSALGTGGNTNIPDESDVLLVDLFIGALSSVSYLAFLNQAQAALVGNEIVLFRTATQISDTVFQLNGLLRGRIGTEWAMAGHIANERFVLLNPNTLSAVTLNTSDLGTTLYFLPHTQSNAAVDSSTAIASPANVARVKPLSPVLFNAFTGSTTATNDISLRWVRRARVNAQWLDGTDVPLDEATESYTLSVSNAAGTVVRAITVTGPFTGGAQPNVVYPAAQILLDGFTAGNTISFAVQQHSDQGLLGYAASTSIVR